MIVIGVTGLSGTGKSTLAELLSKILPNATWSTGDKWMFKIQEEFRSLAIKMFGKEVVDSKEQTLLEYIFGAGEKGREFIQIILPWINEQILKEIQEAQENGRDYFISEWTLLPVLELWKSLDLSVQVVSDESQRHDMLFKRQVGGCDTNKAHKRDEFVSFAFEGLEENVLRLTNSFTPESLKANLIILIENITGLTPEQKQQILQVINSIDLSKYSPRQLRKKKWRRSRTLGLNNNYWSKRK